MIKLWWAVKEQLELQCIATEHADNVQKRRNYNSKAYHLFRFDSIH